MRFTNIFTSTFVAGLLSVNLYAIEIKSLPPFSLPDITGKMHTQTELANKVVIIDFWATWCASCKETIPTLVSLQKKYGEKGLQIVGISLDKTTANKVASFAKKMGITYLVLHDKKDTQSKIYGFEGIPALYVFDAKGQLLKTLNGYSAVAEKELDVLIQTQLK